MISLISLLLLALLLFLLLLLQKYKTKRNLHRLPPGPKGVPLLGNLLQLDNSAPHRRFWQLSQIYGPLMFLRLGFRPTLVVSSAKTAKQVLKSSDLVFANRPSFFSQQKLSFNGSDVAFAPYDTCWRELKKICVLHLFNPTRVQSFQPIREFEVSHLLEKISELVLSSKHPVDLSELVTSLTRTIICRVAFGMQNKDDDDIEQSRFQNLLKETEAMLTSFFCSDYFPLLGFVDKLTGLTSNLEKLSNQVDDLFEKLIQEHLDPDRPCSEKEDILDMLLQFLKDGSSKFHITFNHIKGVLLDICLGGTDSNSAAVIWAMTYLMKNPVSMSKAKKEVRCAIGQKGFVNEDDIEKLHYLKAVVKEAMRLQPTIPIIPRESSQLCNLEDYQIPAKTLVYVNLWAIGRDPEVWKNPEEFCPERFIDNFNNDLKEQNFGLIPFGAGRRTCPGAFMAHTTVELILANLLYKFDWKMPIGVTKEDLDMDVQQGITMHKKNALCLMATSYI